jgi:HK97 family phage portal protein
VRLLNLGCYLVSLRSQIKQLLGFEKKVGTLAAPDAFLLDLFGASTTNAGVLVSPRSAMSCAPVHAAVRAISEAMGTLPAYVYKRGPNGEKQRAPDHPAQQLLDGFANDWTPAGKLREDVTQDAALYPFGGFAYLNWVDGKPYELIRLDPERSAVVIDYSNLEPQYAVREDGKNPARIIARQNILHIPSPSLQGRGMVIEGREAIALAIVLEQYASRLFGNSARPSGVITSKGPLSPTGLANIKSAWNAAHGSGNSGGTAVLPEGVTWQQVVLNSTDAQFLEMRRFAISEISRLWRVPLHMLAELERGTFRNVEQLGAEFLQYTLASWISRWEGELSLKLFTKDERNTFFVEFDTDSFARADMLARLEALSVAVTSRMINPNEARQIAFGLPGYDGGDKFENPNTTSPHAQPRLVGGVDP